MKNNNPNIEDILIPQNGVFIVCEGNFNYSNASLSFYEPNSKLIENLVFLKANGKPLGDVAQSISIKNNTAYISINNSGKIYAIDINDFKLKGKITELSSPRYMVFVSDEKAYVSDMYSKCINIVNPNTFTKTASIDISPNNSEQLIIVNDLLFTNSWSYDDKILVINTNTDKLINTIQVLVQPRKMVLDKENKLWVLCDGGFEGSSFVGERGIMRINTATSTVEKTFIINNNFPLVDMQINNSKDIIYFINKDVYRFSITDSSLPQTPYLFAENKNFYALGIDPTNSDLYVSDACDYMQNGVIYRYNSNKEPLDSFKVGIIPNSFVFKTN
jgi:hypothetical protein